MKSSQWVRIAALAALVLLLAGAQVTAPQETVLPVGSAVVSEVKGGVVFTSPEGATVTAQQGSTLAPESRIETTKGSVLLALGDGSQVLIKPHSQVVLKAPNAGKGYFLEQLIGKVLVKVQKRLGVAPSFRMGTPSAVITVRGTRFEVEVNKKGKTFVDVFEGVVDVGGIIDGSPHVLIRPGFYTGVEQDRSPEQPREMNNEDGPGRDSGREGQGPGTQRSPEDQPRSQPRQPSQGAEKPD